MLNSTCGTGRSSRRISVLFCVRGPNISPFLVVVGINNTLWTAIDNYYSAWSGLTPFPALGKTMAEWGDNSFVYSLNPYSTWITAFLLNCPFILSFQLLVYSGTGQVETQTGLVLYGKCIPTQRPPPEYLSGETTGLQLIHRPSTTCMFRPSRQVNSLGQLVGYLVN